MLKKFTLLLMVAFLSCTNSDNKAKFDEIDRKLREQREPLRTRDTFARKELFFGKDNEQNWGADIRLSYTEAETKPRGTVYKVKSTYKGEIIGFEITVPNPGDSKLTIRSTGINSNNFIQVLSKIYKQKIDTTLQFTSLINADCVNIGDYLDSLNKQANNNYISTKSQYKVFFQGKKEDDYAELYLNVNGKEHWIELEEKDAEYRPVIIKLLTQ